MVACHVAASTEILQPANRGAVLVVDKTDDLITQLRLGHDVLHNHSAELSLADHQNPA